MKRNVLLSVICLLLLPAALGLGESWDGSREIHCRDHRPDCRLLQMVMMGVFDGFDPEDGLSVRVFSAVCSRMSSLTEEDLAHFCQEFQLEGPVVTLRWYAALRACLWARILAEGTTDPARRVLLLFLDPTSETDAEEQMEKIRSAMTEEGVRRISGAVEVPSGFIRWLMALDDPDL